MNIHKERSDSDVIMAEPAVVDVVVQADLSELPSDYSSQAERIPGVISALAKESGLLNF